MKKREWVQALIIPFAGFFLILFGMNGYQYFKVKGNFAAGMVKEIGETELEQFYNFFSVVTENLLLVRDWGQNDVLFDGDTNSLNRKLKPLLERLPQVAGIVMANSQGREYFIYRDGQNFITRTVRGAGNEVNSKVDYSKWSADFVETNNWQELGNYDPRQRPWFEKAVDEPGLHWVGPYTFFQTQKTGLTASVSWKAPKDPETILVVGFDVTIEKIQELLAEKNETHPGVLFITNNDGSLLTFGKESEAGKESGDLRVPLKSLIDHWRKNGRPIDQPVGIEANRQKWLASFYRIAFNGNTSTDNESYWFGHAAEEAELAGWLEQALFQVDIIEVTIALAGSGFLLVLIWRYTGYRTKNAKSLPLEVRLLGYIDEGEGDKVEFKSTVRTNLKSGKVGKEIELAWLKAVVAFLNSQGGTVLLGVDDSGLVCGIAVDQFESNDRCLLHIKNLLNQHIGAEFTSFFAANLVEYENQQVVLIECDPARDAVFLKIGKNEEFYVRSGPSSVKLSPSQMVSYVQQNRQLLGDG